MFFLAWRQLTARKKQSLLILLGISLGTVLFVTISGLQLGMRKYISDSLLNNTAHVLITGSDGTIDKNEVTAALYPDQPVRWLLEPYGKRRETRLENYQTWYTRLSRDPDVVDFSPRLATNVILTNGIFTASSSLIGIDPYRQIRISSIEKYIIAGSFKALGSGQKNIVIGSGVAEEIGARLNSNINVSTGKQGRQTFKVVGISHFGNDQVDKSIAFAELEHVQSLTLDPGRISEIAVGLYNIDDASKKAAEWKILSKDKVQDWQEANKMFMEMIKVQDYTRYFITTAILVVAAFGVYNVLSIMINQKRREIAILRALGYGPEKILELVLYQGLLLGISGGVAGLLLGFILCRIIGSVDLGIEIGGTHSLIISYDWTIYALAFVAANAASIVASYLPARAASRMTPMDVIREES